MADRATQSLAEIKESGDYVLVPDFVVFDEHDEFDENGKLIRRFDRARLQAIVDKCNAREEKSGDLATIAPGHSLDNPKSEEDQPPPWGFAANYRLDHYGPGKKLGIVCDAYVRKQIRTKDGRTVDGPEYLATFPRRSPELWPNHSAVPEHARNTFDWIAVLRRAPQRDLGLSVYHRNGRGEIIGGLTRNHKLRYQMETPMDPVQDPNADTSADLDPNAGGDAGAPPEGHEEFAKHLDYAMNNHPMLKSMCSKYAAEQADPSATNVAPPGAGDVPPTDEDDDPTLQQNARKGDVQKTKYERRLDDQETRIKKAEAELAIERQRVRLQKFEMKLKELALEYEFDVAEELTDVSAMDEKQFDKHCERIQKRYARTPVGGDLPYDAIVEPNPADKNLNDPEVGAQVLKYMNAHPELAQKYGEKAFHEAAKILKFVA